MNFKDMPNARKIFSVSLVGMAVGHLIGTIQVGQFSAGALYVEIPLILLGILVALGIRWAAYIGIAISGLLALLTLVSQYSSFPELLAGEQIRASVMIFFGFLAAISGAIGIRQK
jgi:hypothetical protein